MLAAAVTFFGMGGGVPQWTGPNDSAWWPAVVLVLISLLLPLVMIFRLRVSGTSRELSVGKKACGYCGRESEQDADYCNECGSPFPAPEPQPEPALQHCSEIGGA
jgi:hypothetical protein